MNKQVLILAIATLFLANVAQASIHPSVNITDSKTILVDGADWKSETIRVKIRDARGNVLVNDEMPTPAKRNYNLKNLENGSYTLVIENDLKSTSQRLDITDDAVRISEDFDTVYKPVLNVNGDVVDVNYLSRGDATITFYNGNEELFSEKYKNAMSINQRYSLKNLPSGDYTIAIRSKNGYFVESVTK